MESVKNVAHKVASAVHPSGHSHSHETILVTGASGFVATHILNVFLEHGYNVRGTVRSEATAEKVRKVHPKYLKQLSFAIVKDIAAPGAFDEAVKGVDGVCHDVVPIACALADVCW